MRVSLDKLLSVEGNKYIFCKAAMSAIEKVGNIKDYTQEEDGKVVTNVLNLLLDNKIKYDLIIEEDNEY